ncbi:RNA polymerase sigma factor [Flavobacterium jejuense]|uniref:RNA polymerase sigma factor n=1 Tax=Flavobacterium jejuense TaxID=1544455 RepID=A0ABX0IYI5_9FLAO|nr:RNA polymerase sigma factor [Flavobacterium jejuense]NHN27792.1 RNA polymerase sigma factor [Flavobacterium jejuense]
MNPIETRDKLLINKIMEGDTFAFKDLIDFYKNVSLTLASSIVKNELLAEDVVQTTFIKVYQKLHTFKKDAKFSTWLYRIVVNTAYNELKKQKRHSDIDIAAVYSIEVDEKSGTYLEEEDQKKYIQMALKTIKVDEALVLRLFYLYEHSISEIQEITGFSKSKVKVDLHRGRINMEQQLKKILGNEITHLL